MIDQLGKNLLEHEQENGNLARMLSEMKQQIMDNETAFGTQKKFGCVIIGGIKKIACTVSHLSNNYGFNFLFCFLQIEFVVIEEQIPFEYFLFIDKRSEEVSINCENVESFSRDPKTGRLSLAYTLPKTDWLGRQTEEMTRKVDYMECAEGEDLMRVWAGVKHKL